MSSGFWADCQLNYVLLCAPLRRRKIEGTIIINPWYIHTVFSVFYWQNDKQSQTALGWMSSDPLTVQISSLEPRVETNYFSAPLPFTISSMHGENKHFFPYPFALHQRRSRPCMLLFSIFFILVPSLIPLPSCRTRSARPASRRCASWRPRSTPRGSSTRCASPTSPGTATWPMPTRRRSVRFNEFPCSSSSLSSPWDQFQFLSVEQCS